MINLNQQKITISCESKDFLKRYYQIVGGLFPGNLSDKDREILEAFYLYGGVISPVTRTKVADKLKTTILNVNNYLDRLRKKGAVIMDADGNNVFHKILLPSASTADVIPLNFIFRISDVKEPVQ